MRRKSAPVTDTGPELSTGDSWETRKQVIYNGCGIYNEVTIWQSLSNQCVVQ